MGLILSTRLYLRPEEFQPGPGWQGLVRNPLRPTLRVIFMRPSRAIKGVPNDLREPRFFVYRASLLLAVGRVDEAGPDLERALSLDPNYGEALGAPIDHRRCAKRQGKSAGASAQKSVTADPKSASALIALSYAQQAKFDLEGARASLQQAVQVDPDNALAWASLAEMHMSFGDLDKAPRGGEKGGPLWIQTLV